MAQPEVERRVVLEDLVCNGQVVATLEVAYLPDYPGAEAQPAEPEDHAPAP